MFRSVKAKSERMTGMVNNDRGVLYAGSKSSFEPMSSWATWVPSSLPGAPRAVCQPARPALGPGIWYSHNSTLQGLVSIYNIKYLASIFNGDKWADPDNFRPWPNQWDQEKIMKQLIQDKRSGERWCDVKKHNFMEKIYIFSSSRYLSEEKYKFEWEG